jgi:hypothetical protein
MESNRKKDADNWKQIRAFVSSAEEEGRICGEGEIQQIDPSIQLFVEEMGLLIEENRKHIEIKKQSIINTTCDKIMLSSASSLERLISKSFAIAIF